MTTQKIPLLLGAHVSTEGGLFNALKRGSSIGCTAIQIFTRNNRQWSHPPLSEEEVSLFLNEKKKLNIECVISHASYLINLASDKEAVLGRSISALKKELDRCNALEIPYLVLHPGSHLTLGEEKGLKQLAQLLDSVLKEYKGSTMILLETMAGQGSSLGKTFEQLGWLLKNISEKSKVGICVDTCHIFAAGYSFSTKEQYEELWSTFEKEVGIERIKAFHLNDSKKECDSRVDRHEDIGKGKIGEEGFKLLMNDSRFLKTPKVLETPKEDIQDDVRNMKVLIDLISPTNKKKLLL